MFNKMFHQVDLMQKGMDAAMMRQDVISNNIANADTPDFKASHVEFESMLQAAMDGGGGLKGTVTHAGHFKIGNPSDPLEVYPVAVRETHTTARMDGNNVNIDQEMTELAANYLRYSTMQTQVNSEFAKLRMAIREGS